MTVARSKRSRWPLLPATINTTAVLGSNGFIPGALSNCDGDARNIIEGTIGFWYRVYTGPKGRFQWGPQYSYLVKQHLVRRERRRRWCWSARD